MLLKRDLEALGAGPEHHRDKPDERRALFEQILAEWLIQNPGHDPKRLPDCAKAQLKVRCLEYPAVFTESTFAAYWQKDLRRREICELASAPKHRKRAMP
jgi:hypothetical protein